MIKHLRMSLFVLFATLALVPVAHGFPVVDTCKGALEPSQIDGCEGVGWEGCCDVTGRQFWCEGGDLYCVDCANGFPACGWNPFGYYDCGQVPMSEDPSGEHAYACGACSPECAEGAGCSADCSFNNRSSIPWPTANHDPNTCTIRHSSNMVCHGTAI